MTTASKKVNRKRPRFKVVKSDVSRDSAYNVSYIPSPKQLKESLVLNAIFGLLDGVTLSNSLVKYAFDLYATNSSISSSDEMHDFMVTNAGMISVFGSSLFIVILSVISNVYGEKDAKEDSKKATSLLNEQIVFIWPYLRDMMKSLKNAYKGLRSTLIAFDAISDRNLNSMLLPLGIFLGVMSMINRGLLRYMRDERKKMMKDNNKLLEQIQNSSEKINSEKFKSQIRTETDRAIYTALACGTYSGFVDGMYLYMGVLSVAALSPEVFIALTVISSSYILINIATRIYEEFDFQRDLRITKAKVELAICGKELGELFADLKNNFLSIAEMTKGNLSQPDVKKLYEALTVKMEEYKEKQKIVDILTKLSWPSSWLLGLKNGLTLYGAITSVMFAGVAISSLLFISFPPVFVILCVASGVLSLLGFLAHSIRNNCNSLQKTKPQRDIANQQLIDLLTMIKETIRDAENIEPTPIKVTPDFSVVSESIGVGVKLDSSLKNPKSPGKDWFEVVRSLGSGVGKGQKVVDFVFNYFQELGGDGHYKDSNRMISLSLFFAPFTALILASYAYGRGFGSDKSNASKSARLLTEDNPRSGPGNVQLPKAVPSLVHNNQVRKQTSQLPSFSLFSYRSREMVSAESPRRSSAKLRLN